MRRPASAVGVVTALGLFSLAPMLRIIERDVRKFAFAIKRVAAHRLRRFLMTSAEVMEAKQVSEE